jgi:hypothetical protein
MSFWGQRNSIYRKEFAEISYFDIGLKNNTMVLWTDNFVWN